MYERFTDRARRVVVLAQEAARELNHNYIGTEHVLLGLLGAEGGVADKALESLGVNRRRVMEDVKDIIGMGQSSPQGHIPFTPRAKKVLELALREALQLGHNYIGTEHILLGLIREGEGVAAEVMKRHTDLASVKKQVLRALLGEPESQVEHPDVAKWTERAKQPKQPKKLSLLSEPFDANKKFWTNEAGVPEAERLLRDLLDDLYPEDAKGKGEVVFIIDSALLALDLLVEKANANPA